jgi:hypothetical protein
MKGLWQCCSFIIGSLELQGRYTKVVGYAVGNSRSFIRWLPSDKDPFASIRNRKYSSGVGSVRQLPFAPSTFDPRTVMYV